MLGRIFEVCTALSETPVTLGSVVVVNFDFVFFSTDGAELLELKGISILCTPGSLIFFFPFGIFSLWIHLDLWVSSDPFDVLIFRGLCFSGGTS